jgi:hypothetical protein
MAEWISNGTEFGELFLKCMTCVFIDNGREPTSLVRLSFDDAGICTRKFAALLQSLMEYSGDPSCFYVVLRPDPIHYFHRLFGKYPAFEILRGMSPEEYLASLNKGPEQFPADAIGTNYTERVIIPPSLRWFVHSYQSSEYTDGHLWVPPEWVDGVSEAYPLTSTIRVS